MPETVSLRVGCVQYLNARPLIHGWPGKVVFDHPSALCAALAAGALDVALVSSFEFLRNPIYRIVNNVSISSRGRVYSVVVAHCQDMSEVEQLDLDPASRTSVNLLRCLLAERGLQPQLVEGGGAATPQANVRGLTGVRPSARLLIGDQAIRFRQRHPEFRYWDLGQEWKNAYELPFVYALWLIRPELARPTAVADRLRALLHENLAHIDRVIAAQSDFDHEFCRSYYQENLHFGFGDEEKKGLQKFHALCVKHALLPLTEISLGAI